MSATTPLSGTAAESEATMASTPTTTVSPRSAAPGGLPGYEMRCECGSVHTTSLSHAEAEQMAAVHEDWHRRREGK